MKKLFKILKVILTVVFFTYTAIIVFFMFLAPKETRFKLAGNLQGVGLSQSVFDIITFQHPDYAEAYFEQSVPFNKRGEYAKGFELLDKAVENDPKMHLGYRGYMKLRFLRDYENAIKDFDRLDTLTPNFVDAPWGEDINFLRGESYFGTKDYNKAIIFFNQNIKNNKEDWVDLNTFVYLGLSEYELGNYEKAILEYERALNQTENMPEAHLGLAKAYLKLENLDKANEHILKAEKTIQYKRTDPYKEFLNTIYLADVEALKTEISLYGLK